MTRRPISGAPIIGRYEPNKIGFGGFDLRLEDRAGLGYETLLQARNTLLGKARQNPTLAGVRPNQLEAGPSVNMEVDRLQAQAMGMSLTEIYDAIRLMLAAHELTGNVAYLHRADHFGRLAMDLFLDDASPLPKLTSHDDFYEIESVTDPSTDDWMLAALELEQRSGRHLKEVELIPPRGASCAAAKRNSIAVFRQPGGEKRPRLPLS